MDDKTLVIIGLIIAAIAAIFGIMQYFKKPEPRKETATNSVTSSGEGDAINGDKYTETKIYGDKIDGDKILGDKVATKIVYEKKED